VRAINGLARLSTAKEGARSTPYASGKDLKRYKQDGATFYPAH